MFKVIALITSAFLLGWPASAGSRVGTGTITNIEVGFETRVPSLFNQVLISANGDIRLDGGEMLGGSASRRQSVFVLSYLLANRQPQWVGRSDRKEFVDHFVRLGWTPVAMTDSCIQAFKKDNGSHRNWVLSWGDGRGVIFTGPELEIVKQSLDDMANHLKLFSGACSWK